MVQVGRESPIFAKTHDFGLYPSLAKRRSSLGVVQYGFHRSFSRVRQRPSPLLDGGLGFRDAQELW